MGGPEIWKGENESRLNLPTKPASSQKQNEAGGVRNFFWPRIPNAVVIISCGRD